MVSVYAKIFNHFENVHWPFYILMIIVKMILCPILLVFTIKHSKNNKPKPIIPNRPMFYDSEVDQGMQIL